MQTHFVSLNSFSHASGYRGTLQCVSLLLLSDKFELIGQFYLNNQGENICCIERFRLNLISKQSLSQIYTIYLLQLMQSYILLVYMYTVTIKSQELNGLWYQYYTSGKPTIIRFTVFIVDENFSPDFEKGVKGGIFNFVKEKGNVYLVTYH